MAGSVYGMEEALSSGGDPNTLSEEGKSALYYSLGLHEPSSENRENRISMVSALLSRDFNRLDSIDLVIYMLTVDVLSHALKMIDFTERLKKSALFGRDADTY